MTQTQQQHLTASLFVLFFARKQRNTKYHNVFLSKWDFNTFLRRKAVLTYDNRRLKSYIQATMFKTFSRLGYRPTQTTEDRITLNKGKDYMRRFVKKIDKKQSEDNEDLRAVIIYIKTHGSQGSGKLLQAVLWTCFKINGSTKWSWNWAEFGLWLGFDFNETKKCPRKCLSFAEGLKRIISNNLLSKLFLGLVRIILTLRY